MSRQWRFTCEGRYQIDTARRWRAECREHPGRYRLPSEAEWEKAARGGLSGQRFPWGETISHAQANYDGNTSNTFGFRIVRSSVH